MVFGLLYSNAQAEVIVPNNSTWKWLHPTDGKDPAKDNADFHTKFYKVDFDDSKWNEGKDKPGPTGGFGYGEENFDYVNIGEPAPENRKTAYFRLKFKTEKAFEFLKFKCQRDDGVIVYLDGKEVARENVPKADEANDLFADKTIGSDEIPDETEVVTIPIMQKLEPGEHILAISLHNRGPIGDEYSSDLRIAEISLSGEHVAR
jgi:hypothetical protein